MINAVQVMEFVKTKDEADRVETALAALDGFLGGRVYVAIANRYDAASGRIVGEPVGWNVQMLFEPGTMVGRDVIILDCQYKMMGIKNKST